MTDIPGNFPINGVDTKNFIPGGSGKEGTDISSLPPNSKARETLKFALRHYFDPDSNEFLDIGEQKKFYAAVGDKVTEEKLDEIISKFRTDKRVSEFTDLLLSSGDYTMRCKAAKILGEIGNPGAVDTLVKALTDKNINVRLTAAWALGKIGDRRAEPALIKELKKNKDPHARLIAAYALHKMGYPGAISAVVKELDNKNQGVREHAVYILGKIGIVGGPVIASTLEKTKQNDASLRVRKIADEALKAIKKEET